MNSTAMADKKHSGQGWTASFCSGLPESDRAYVLNGPTYKAIHRLAAGINALVMAAGEERKLLCLCTENKVLLAAALIASLTGGPRLVFPYAFSRQAVEEVLKTMPVSALLADRPGDFPPGLQVILPAMVKEAAPTPGHYIDADEPFLMLFTGGSTGTPKVWAKTPRNMIEEALYMTARFGITADDIFLSTVPPQHIYGLLFSVLVPLMAGARVLEGTYVFPREILNMAGESGATVLVSVPACYRVLKGDSLERHSLRLAFSSAGALDPGDADYFREKTALDINEIYGSTETGGVATRRRGCDGDAWNGLDPVAWRIADGRLQVRSPFISPSLPRNEDGFFITADRAEEDGKGRFILRGRADDVVKIGGKRVDLAEIQEKIRNINGIYDALVLMLPRAKGRQADLAVLVVTDLDPGAVRQKMNGLIEPYAVPRRIVVVDKIPVTSTGKYDRREIEGLLKPGR